jgi:hypothetical protein
MRKRELKPFYAQLLVAYLLAGIGLNMISARRAQAQIPVTDVVHNVNTVIQTAGDLVRQGIAFAHELKYSEVLKYLKAISNGVATYQKVQRIVNSQIAMGNAAVANVNAMRQNRFITPQQLQGMVSMYGYFAQQSLANLGELKKLLSPNVFQMEDAERIGIIDKIALDTQELEHSFNYYEVMNKTLAGQKQREAEDMAKLTALYTGSTVSPKETPVGAHARIGGFFGSIVNLLYGISALVGLIGATRVYSKFTSGDSSVHETAAAWFGSVLLAVMITTVIQRLFF